MRNLRIPLSLAALAVLAACATQDPVAPAPAPVVVAPAPAPVVTTPPATVVVPPATATTVPPTIVATPTAIRAGFGRVETITALPTSAATGSGQIKPQRRIGIKMDDGTVQYVDTAAEGLSIGERIELTADGMIKH